VLSGLVLYGLSTGAILGQAEGVYCCKSVKFEKLVNCSTKPT
jgi:hypothetical protein